MSPLRVTPRTLSNRRDYEQLRSTQYFVGTDPLSTLIGVFTNRKSAQSLPFLDLPITEHVTGLKDCCHYEHLSEVNIQIP